MTRRVTRFYYASYRWLAAADRLLIACHNLSRACFAGVWLGLMRRDTLLEIADMYYAGKRQYRDDTYNRSGLWVWEQAVISRYFGRGKRLLVLGAGGGREVLALARLGYDVRAVECNPDLVQAANRLLAQEGLATCVEYVPPDTCPASGVNYDGLIVGWGAYMLIQGRARRVALLRKMRALVQPGTPILLSFFVRSPRARRFHVIAVTANALRRLRRDEALEIGDSLEPEYVHYFTRDEITAELRSGGFALEYYSEQQYGHGLGLASGPPDAATPGAAGDFGDVRRLEEALEFSQ